MKAAASVYRSAEGERIVNSLYDRVLARWPVPWTPLEAPTRHGRTFAIASGPADAPALVLLHGAASNAVSWVGDAAAYSRRFRVLAVDSPGDPGRSEQVRPSWRGPALAEWLADVLDAAGARTASLVGLSQGGRAALRFATLHPERVDRLVLLAPGGVVRARPGFLLKAVGLSLIGRPKAINRVVLGKDVMAPEGVEFMNTIMTHFIPRIEAEVLFSDEELRRLTMPVLLIAGADDAVLSARDTAARLQRLLPRLTTRILPGRGHALVNMAEEILPFLEAA